MLTRAKVKNINACSRAVNVHPFKCAVGNIDELEDQTFVVNELLPLSVI